MADSDNKDKNLDVNLIKSTIYKKYLPWAIGKNGKLSQNTKGHKILYVNKIPFEAVVFPKGTSLYQVFYLNPSYIEVRNGPKYYVKILSLADGKVIEINSTKDLLELDIEIKDDAKILEFGGILSKLLGGEMLFASSKKDLMVFSNRLSMLGLSTSVNVFKESKEKDWTFSITKNNGKMVIRFPHIGLERLKSVIYRVEIVDGKIKSIGIERILFKGLNFL